MVRLTILVLLLSIGVAEAQQCGTITTCPPVSTPTSGAELLYIVQNGVSKKIALSQIGGAGGGNVSNTGTPGNGQIAVWASATVIGGATVAGDCTFASPNLTCTMTNGVSFGVFATAAAASKSDQQAAASNALVVTPLHQQDSDSAIKASVNFVGATGVINSSFNVTTTPRSGTGVYVVNFATPFASATSYGCVANTETTAAIIAFCVNIAATKTASSVAVDCFNGSTVAAVDPAVVNLVCYGRQ